jgi:hypothetical protein
MVGAYYYRQAIFAVDPGACNLSGLARSLPDMLAAIEAESGVISVKVSWNVRRLNEAVTRAWKRDGTGTRTVNTDSNVKRYVARLVTQAYASPEDRIQHMNARHPIMRLVIDQMRQLAEVAYPDNTPDYTEKWSGSYDICKEKGRE